MSTCFRAKETNSKCKKKKKKNDNLAMLGPRRIGKQRPPPPLLFFHFRRLLSAIGIGAVLPESAEETDDAANGTSGIGGAFECAVCANFTEVDGRTSANANANANQQAFIHSTAEAADLGEGEGEDGKAQNGEEGVEYAR